MPQGAPPRLAGSGAAAAWWLANGRRVRHKACGRLGVVLPAGGCEGGGGKSQGQGQGDGAAGARAVRLAGEGGGACQLRPDELEPWTRGVRVRLRSSGRRGELVQVLRAPPADRPYLVRFEDGSEDWLSVRDVSFEALGRRGSSMASEAARHQAELCDVTLVPGRWRLGRATPPAAGTPTPVAVLLSCTPEGEVRGTGEDGLGAFKLVGREQGGCFQARLEYTRGGGGCAVVGSLDGAWIIEDGSPRRSWAAIAAGSVSIAGSKVGSIESNGINFRYVKRETGQSQRAILHDEYLCFDDGVAWRRLEMNENMTGIGELFVDTMSFDPPKQSEQHEGDGVCKLSSLTFDSQVLRVSFEASSAATLPDVLKTELSVDGRVMEATRAQISATLSQNKRFRSQMKGEMLFDDVCLSVGSAVRLRYGGQYSGYSWVSLIPAPEALTSLIHRRACSMNPLETKYLEGSVAADGLKIDGVQGEGPVVTVSGKTASAIKLTQSGRITTVSLRPYDNEDLAKIEVRGPAKIHFTFFKTEASYDTLEIAGKEYSGDERPPPYFVPEGQRSVMVWKSDESTTDEGWEFVVAGCTSYLQIGEREMEFGAHEAPWNEAGMMSRCSGAVRPVSCSAAAFEPVASEVAGHLLLFCPEPDGLAAAGPDGEGGDDDAGDAGDDDAGDTPLDESSVFCGSMLELVRKAELAGASGVAIAAPSRTRRGALQLLGADQLASLADSGGAWPSIPAVMVGREVSEEIASALERGERVAVGPRACCFSMVLERPAELDGSRELARLCLGSPNVLRAVLDAELELERAAAGTAGGAPPPGPPGTCPGLPALLWARLLGPRGGGSPTPLEVEEQEGEEGEGQGERRHVPELPAEASPPQAVAAGEEGQGRERAFRELLRGLVPLRLPMEALLPPPGRGSQGRRVWDYYCKGRGLGAGSFGVVRQAWDRFAGGHVAVKKIVLKGQGNVDREDVMKEFGLLRDLSHPNLLRVLDIFAQGKKLYLVTEYAAAGDLSRYIATRGKIDELWIAAVTRQVLAACRCLHLHKIVHHDIKPANILVTTHHLDAPENHVPLVLVADFGLAQVERFVDHEAREQAGAGNGTSYYMAPESAKGFSGPKTDVYAIGIMLFELLSGGNCPDPISDDGLTAPVDWESLSHCSPEAVNVTRGLIDPDVGTRLTCEASLALGWFWPHLQKDSSAHNACPECGADGLGVRAAELAATAIRRLFQHAQSDFVQRALKLLFIAQLGRTELEEARQAFHLLDADCDGQVSDADLAIAIEKSGGCDHSASSLLLAIDTHGQGFLEFGNFAAAYVDVHTLPPVVAAGITEKLFLQLSERTGVLDLPSLWSRFACADEGEAEVLARLFHRHDTAGDGRLTREEFFSVLGLHCSPWTPQPPPERREGSVRVLRGTEREATVEGRCVESWSFATFGQPRLGRTRGQWYYELSIMKCEYPQVGWADSEFKLEDSASDDGVGDDEHSWGIDGVRQLKWSNGSEDWGELWPRPVVIGCAVDLGTGEMTFSVDGQWEAEPAFRGILFSGAVYPAASGVLVGAFNFAPSDCRYPPPAGYRHLCTEAGVGLPPSPRPASP